VLNRVLLMTYRNYVNGEWIKTTTDTFSTYNPSNGEEIGNFYKADKSLTQSAIEAASESFEQWKDLSYIERAEYMWSVYNRLKNDKQRLSKIVTEECGKEIGEGRADIVEAAHMVEWAAGNARHPHGDVVPSEIPERDSYMRRKPRGVTACITPWNFPVAIPFWHMAVALVEGNTVVWKPSEQTPLCGKVVADIMDDVGIPDGVFNLVQGSEETGEVMVEHDDVDTVLFTGSAEVGELIQRQVAEDHGKQIACEMGGKNSMLVTEDADIELAVKCAILSSFKTTGQRCVSTERVIVHDSVYDEFKRNFVTLAQDIQVGDPLNEDSFMGPLINEEQVNRFHQYNELARKEGANVLVNREQLTDDNIPDGLESGNWVGPFVYEINYDDHRCLQEEVFGPHVALLKYSGGVKRGVNIHNDTDYGLTGAIVSENRRQINYFRDNAEVGLAYANIPCIGAEVQLPFGGVKKSGNGYPSAREIIEVVTDRVAWTVNNGTDVKLAQDLSSEITVD